MCNKQKGVKMKIDIRSENSLYIELNGHTYYIDDSTDEQIMDCWETKTMHKIRKIQKMMKEANG